MRFVAVIVSYLASGALCDSRCRIIAHRLDRNFPANGPAQNISDVIGFINESTELRQGHNNVAQVA